MKHNKLLTGQLFFNYDPSNYGEWLIYKPCDARLRWYKCINSDTGYVKQFHTKYIMTKERY